MEYLHTWGECSRRGQPSATDPARALPHLARPRYQTECRCAWCGAPCPDQPLDIEREPPLRTGFLMIVEPEETEHE
jgi:hypothetical protein